MDNGDMCPDRVQGPVSCPPTSVPTNSNNTLVRCTNYCILWVGKEEERDYSNDLTANDTWSWLKQLTVLLEVVK